MKRIGYIYDKICSKDNIRQAAINASRNKRSKQPIKRILENIDKYVDLVHELLITKSYVPSPYVESIIKDGLSKKERVIHKPRFFPDQIIHWSLMQQIQPILSRGMYDWCSASVKSRGTHHAKKACEKWIRGDRANTKYCLKIDVKKYYPNINIHILKEKFRRLIKDKDVLWLIDSIIDSHNQGLPIGNYTSQWFANFYLQDTDHYIKEKLGVKYYIRYMDDLVMFGPNKRKLRQVLLKVKEKLESEKLMIKGNYQIFNIEKRKLDFCGFVFTRNKTFVRKRITKNMLRQYVKFIKTRSLHSARSLMSYYGWILHSDSYILYKKYYGKINVMKEVIANA